MRPGSGSGRSRDRPAAPSRPSPITPHNSPWRLALVAVLRGRADRSDGPAPVLRVVEGGLRRLGHQEGRQSVGQRRDGALQGREVFGGADHAPPAAFGLDLLLDVLDLGPDLREAIPGLLRGLLWLSPLAGFAHGHGRSPCDGCVGKRRLSTSVWEKRNPAPRHRFFRIAPCPYLKRSSVLSHPQVPLRPESAAALTPANTSRTPATVG
jgi:hypothetical protein